MKSSKILKAIIIVIIANSFLYSNTILATEPISANIDYNLNDYVENTYPVTLEDNCKKLGSWDENYGIIYDVFVTRINLKKYAFVAAGLEGLIIVDVTNEKKPRFISQFIDGSTFILVTASENFVYLATSYGKLSIFDISIIGNPILVSESFDLDHPKKIQIVDNYAYIADSWNGFVILDISNKTNPILITEVSISYFDVVYDFVLKESIVYLVGWDFLSIVDITNPLSPIILGQLSIDDSSFGLDVTDDLAIVTLWSKGVLFIDITNLTNPFVITKYWDSKHVIQDVFIHKNKAILLSKNEGLVIIDISDINNLVKVFETSIGQYNYNAYLYKKFVYIVDIYKGIYIYNVEKMTEEPIGIFSCAGYTYDIHVKDNYAYLANGYSGLIIVDVRDPKNPKEIGRYESNTIYYLSVFVQGNFAYCFNAMGDMLDIIDISNKDNPIKLTVETDFPYRFSCKCEITVDDNYAYAVHRRSGWYGDIYSFIKVYDISNKSNPVVLFEEYYYSEFFHKVEVYNDYLLIGTKEGLYIYNKTIPQNLSLIKNYHHLDYKVFMGFDVVGDIVYLAEYNYGILIVNISDINNIELVSQYSALSQFNNNVGVYKIQFYNDIVYLSDDVNGIIILDVHDLANIVFVGQFYEARYSGYIEENLFGLTVHNIIVEDNLLYLSDGYGGMKIIHYNKVPLSQSHLALIVVRSLIAFTILFAIIVLLISYKKR